METKRRFVSLMSKILTTGILDYILEPVTGQFRKYSIWLLCLCFVAGPAFGGAGGVLCIGADDLMKVEQVCRPCCTDTDENCSIEQTSLETEFHDSCYGCTDIPLSHESLSGRNFRTVSIYKTADFGSADGPMQARANPAVLSATDRPTTLSPPPVSRVAFPTIVLIC